MGERYRKYNYSEARKKIFYTEEFKMINLNTLPKDKGGLNLVAVSYEEKINDSNSGRQKTE